MIIAAVVEAMSEQASQKDAPLFSLQTATWWFDVASWVLAISLGIGFICTVIVIVMGTAKEHHWDLLREAANKELGKAQQDAGKANKEAAETRERAAKIEERIAPRVLSVAAASDLNFVLPSYPGRTIRVVSYALDAEAAVLATQILANVSVPGIRPIDARLSYSVFGSLAFGVRVFGTDASLVESLIRAIAISNIDVSEEPLPPSSGISSGNLMAPVSATIFVAAKPPPR